MGCQFSKIEGAMLKLLLFNKKQVEGRLLPALYDHDFALYCFISFFWYRLLFAITIKEMLSACQLQQVISVPHFQSLRLFLHCPSVASNNCLY